MKKTLTFILILCFLNHACIYAQSNPKPLSTEQQETILKWRLNKKILLYIAKYHSSLTSAQLLDIEKNKTPAATLLFTPPLSSDYTLPLNVKPASSRFVSVIPNIYIAEVDDWYLTNGIDTVNIPLTETFRREDKRYKIYYHPDEFGGMPQIISGQSILSQASFLISKYDLRGAVNLRLNRFEANTILSPWMYYPSIKSTKADTLALEWVLERHGIDTSTQAFFCMESSLSFRPIIVIVTKTKENGQPYFGDIKVIYYEHSWEKIKEGEIIEYPDGTKIRTIPTQISVYDEVCIPIVAEPKNIEAISIQRQRISKEEFNKYKRFIVRYRTFK